MSVGVWTDMKSVVVYVNNGQAAISAAHARKVARALLEHADIIDPPAPPSQPVETSEAAADAAWRNSARDREWVLRFLRDCGPSTDEEIAEGIPLPPNTARPRRVELVRSGLVRDSGTRAKTKAGRQAIRWEAV